ncbi:ATP-binding cassette domain-containing protein [Nisaea acidiphila]|uniref:ATP-binding cassette domain-containing protein n=1 Tax=Nisaea acidiphila TaxID=1862145 RepID=A0A9J7AZN9_9PROT|nr:ATP-binding cassette domain-containing protein [Nisaea acidiphila]UUX51716.1 ATP-binding cassette domain-containing protein [Nisaea acidiphila]
MLSVQGLTKSYGDLPVLEKIDLEVEEGAFCAIVGASGCGKSTFLRLLLGQEVPSSGEIALDGKILPPEPTPERGIVFQRYSVFPHLTARENLLLAHDFEGSPLLARAFGTRRADAEEMADALLERTGLANARDRFPAQLSGGMQQRLAIAQTLMKRPRLLLLDEPFGALDPGVRLEMHELLLELWREHGMTIFMVTHDLSEAFKLGTRVLTFDKVRHDPQFPNAYGATITYDLAADGSAFPDNLPKEDPDAESE